MNTERLIRIFAGAFILLSVAAAVLTVASPVLAGDKLYCAREDGTVMVGRVTDGGFELLAENEMGEQLIASQLFDRPGQRLQHHGQWRASRQQLKGLPLAAEQLFIPLPFGDVGAGDDHACIVRPVIINGNVDPLNACDQGAIESPAGHFKSEGGIHERLAQLYGGIVYQGI